MYGLDRLGPGRTKARGVRLNEVLSTVYKVQLCLKCHLNDIFTEKI